MRGYGGTCQPQSVDDYTQPVLARDVVRIAQQLGYDKFVVVGHDWGAMLAWSVSLLYPQNVLGVFGMSVPYVGLGRRGLLTMLQENYGPCLDPSLPREIVQQARFQYMLYHCLPRCDEEYDKHAEEFLYRIYGYRKGCNIQPGTPEHHITGLMFPPTGNQPLDSSRTLDATAAPGWWERIPRPVDLPPWFKQKDLDYIVGEFKQSGFLGGISWYRAADRNFEMMKKLLDPKNGGHGEHITVPSAFMIGEDDAVLDFHGGKTKVQKGLRKYLPALIMDPIFVPNCGHWIQQEASALVNDVLFDFLESVVGPLGPQQDLPSTNFTVSRL
jgi:pimeloyl-ACP methyl ester carboxylesterase